jgi:hypothetical protein
MSQNLWLRGAGRSDVGLVRENNEDSGFIGKNIILVADGMGGHAAGELASSTAVAVATRFDNLFSNNKETADSISNIPKQITLEIGQKLHRTARIVAIQCFPHLAQPVFKHIHFVAHAFDALVFPVGSESAFGNFIHAFGANLNLYISALWTDDGGVQRFVSVCFGGGNPVFQAFGNGFIIIRNRRIHLPTGKAFVRSGYIDHNSDRKEVINIL